MGRLTGLDNCIIGTDMESDQLVYSYQKLVNHFYETDPNGHMKMPSNGLIIM